MDELNTSAAPRGGAAQARPARWPVVLAAAVLAMGGLASWLLLTREDLPAPVVQEPAPAPTRAQAPAPSAPPMSTAQSDALLRQRLGGLSTAPEWATWLQESDLLRRFVGVVAAFAAGESPRALVGFLAPRGSFEVREKAGRLLIAPESYARYDAIGRVVGALDVEVLASVFREVRPVVDVLYREGAPLGSTFDAALGRAFDRVLAVPLLQGDVAVVQKGATYAFADPALEGLTPAEKHLLRMGPKTVRTLKEQVRRMAAALDVRLSQR